MLEKYYSYLFYIMGYTYGLIRKSKKKNLQVYRFEGYKVVFLNDYSNRRLLVWFYEEKTKKLYRTSFHGFYVRKIRLKIVNLLKNIREDNTYFKEVLMKKRSYSYRKERAFKNYINYQSKK